jgi:UDP-N-acetylmuramoylalanine--D-glutamate ligase
VAERRDASGRPLARISVVTSLEDGLFAADGGVLDARETPAVFYDLRGQGSLRGAHNAQNAAAAIAAARAMGVEHAAIQQGLASFPGLAHRMEQVGRIGRVLFINDSKATNADATEKALAAFPGGIHWILGGLPKEGGIEPLAPYFPRVSRAYLIGQASEAFAATLGDGVPHEACGTLDAAIAAAARHAAEDGAEEPVVLLSPACASFDQFPNFEMRGARFRDIVLALPGLVPAGTPQHGEA